MKIILPFLSVKKPNRLENDWVSAFRRFNGLSVLCAFKCRPEHENGKTDRHKPESVGRYKWYRDEISQNAEDTDDQGRHPNHLFWG
jgi:hypothetical protein